MNYINRVLERGQYADKEFLAGQEMEVMMEIAAYIAGRNLEEGDAKRLSRHAVTNETGAYVIFWDGVRKGIMYSGFELNRKPEDKDPPVWLMFYVPEEDLVTPN